MNLLRNKLAVTSVSEVICVAQVIASLVPCPDCEQMVSRRAFMCPNCGCKGDVIAEVAKTIPEPMCGDILDADCDGMRSHALPLILNGRRFAVLPLDPVLGVSRLVVSHKGLPVEWSVSELAIDAPIVRLQIASTNLTYWIPGGDLVFAGMSIKPKGIEVSAIVSPLISTNAFALSNREWQVLQPKQMKNHGRQILKMLKGEPSELPQHTHPFFKMIENKKKENAR